MSAEVGDIVRLATVTVTGCRVRNSLSTGRDGAGGDYVVKPDSIALVVDIEYLRFGPDYSLLLDDGRIACCCSEDWISMIIVSREGR